MLIVAAVQHSPGNLAFMWMFFDAENLRNALSDKLKPLSTSMDRPTSYVAQSFGAGSKF